MGEGVRETDTTHRHTDRWTHRQTYRDRENTYVHIHV